MREEVEAQHAQAADKAEAAAKAEREEAARKQVEAQSAQAEREAGYDSQRPDKKRKANEDAKNTQVKAAKQQPQKRKPKRQHDGADQEAIPPKCPKVPEHQKQQIQVASECKNSEAQKYKHTSIQFDRN